MDPLHVRLDTLDHHLQILQQQTRTMARRLRWWRGLACSLVGLGVLTWAMPSGTAQGTLEQRVAALEAKLAKLAFDPATSEMVLSGANLRVVNGLGRTGCRDEQGNPIANCPNGLGNLIVGYNEPREEEFGPNVRTGSHNVVVGTRHNFSRVGGLVIGSLSEISGDFAVVSGGLNNTASGEFAVVSGGSENTASAEHAVVSGGVGNRASRHAATVSGGLGNQASGEFSTVSGGHNNLASGEFSMVSGGENNLATGYAATVNGGENNLASGIESSVSGGKNNEAAGEHASVSGGRDVVQKVKEGWAAGLIGGEVTGSFRSP